MLSAKCCLSLPGLNVLINTSCSETGIFQANLDTATIVADALAPHVTGPGH